MQSTFAFSVLRLMFVEARQSLPPSPERLSLLLGAPRAAIQEALAELERAGLVDARRARLTMIGLATAAATQSAESRRPSSQSRVLAA